MKMRILCFVLALTFGCDDDEELAPLKVHALYPVAGDSESSLAFAVQQGILEARIGSDFVFEGSTPESQEQAAELLEAALAPQPGRRLIITVGAGYVPLLDARECDLNGAQVLHLQGRPNVCARLRSIELQTYAPGFLAGVLAISAESIAPRRAAGVVSAAPAPEVASMIEGFAAGSEYAGGHIEALELDSFDPEKLDDPETARGALAALVAGVDVLLVAGSTDSELVFEAVRARNAEQPEQPLRVIGVDQDVSVVDAESSLGTVFRRYRIEVRNSILAAQVDAFAPGQVWRGFYDGESGLVVNPAYADTPLGATSFACEGCMTLSDAVREAAPAAAAAEKEQTSTRQ
jgi:basic membrane lipoprotein Med (substrate-binding protein (PBP1-ABC) superfamily)